MRSFRTCRLALSLGGRLASNGHLQRPLGNRATHNGQPTTAAGVVDLGKQVDDADVELHFQRVMEHVKSTPSEESLEGDLRVKRVHEDVRGHNVDGMSEKGEGGSDAPRSFFDDGGMDVRGKGPPKPGAAKGRSLDILGLSGTTRQRSAVVDSAGSLESLAPSDPTLVDEDEQAYGDTPTELTDMLKERLIELKAEKLSKERDETVLRRRLDLPEKAAAPSLQLAVGISAAPKPAQRRNSTTLADDEPTSPKPPPLDCRKEDDANDQMRHKRRREGVSSYLLEEVPDLVPGMSSYDPFHDMQSSTHPSSSDGPRSASSEEDGVLLLRCLQRASLTSRREAIELVASGEVLVDGVVERNPFRRVVASNNIKVRGHAQRLQFSPSRLWIYHKPANVIVSRHDPAGRALFTKHAQVLGIGHLIPIGSLPFKSHGILLLTNDGELASVLSHPKANIQQSYHFRVKPAIDPVLANKLNTEGVRINGVVHKEAEFLVNHANRSRYYVKVKVRGESMPVHQLLGHLGRKIERGGRVSLGPFGLCGLPPGGLREVTVPPFFMKHVAAVWKPFVERDWPSHRRQRVRSLQRLSRFRELRAKELEEMDAFTFDEFKDALSYESRELSEEAERVASLMEKQPRVDDAALHVFPSPDEQQARRPTASNFGTSFGSDEVFVDDITRAA